MSGIETVRVKSGSSYAIINKTDYDPSQHKLFDAEIKAAIGDDNLTDEERELLATLEAKRKVQGNFGQTSGVAIDAAQAGRNPSGINPAGGEGEDLPVEIPADWVSAHWKTQVALAEKLSGRDVTKAEEAREIIAAEVAKRA